jgi:hypothetical protein
VANWLSLSCPAAKIIRTGSEFRAQLIQKRLPISFGH